MGDLQREVYVRLRRIDDPCRVVRLDASQGGPAADNPEASPLRLDEASRRQGLQRLRHQGLLRALLHHEAQNPVVGAAIIQERINTYLTHILVF